MNQFSWWRMIYWRFRWYIYPRRRYVTRCQYCGLKTGITMHAWATEDICTACAAPSILELLGHERRIDGRKCREKVPS